MSDNIYLIGGVDSFGVPYTRDNKNHINHLKVVRDYLIENGYEVRMIDMYSMHSYNDTDYINSLLHDKIDLYTIRQNQMQSISLCRKSGIFQYVQLPEKTKSLYTPLAEDRETFIKDIIEQNQVIFIYSCGVNDFLKNMDTNLAKLLKPVNMKKAFTGIEQTTKLIMEKIISNIEVLIELNSNIEIYILGIYTPTRVSYIRNRVVSPLSIYNAALKEVCSHYENVHYVDNSNLSKKDMAPVDWHPNYRGQNLMGENIVSEIKQQSKIIKLK